MPHLFFGWIVDYFAGLFLLYFLRSFRENSFKTLSNAFPCSCWIFRVDGLR